MTNRDKQIAELRAVLEEQKAKREKDRGELDQAKREAQRAKYALIASQNEMLAAAKEYDQKLEETRKDLWDTFEKTETRLEAALEKMRGERDDARRRAKDHSTLLTEARAKLADIQQRFDYVANLKAELSARQRHIVDVLADGFTPPQIDEIRKVRGLEPLSTKGTGDE